jgi:flagellar assembly protein FliH
MNEQANIDLNNINTQNNKLTKNNKFLFDLNDFNTPDEAMEEETIIEEEVFVEPPPPTFSEDDLEAAKTIAHASGRMEGMNEEKEKRDQKIVDLLEEIKTNFSSLHASETYREKQYEEESLRLALGVIHKLAPSLQSKLGKEALQSALENTLTSQTGHTEIRVEVHPDMASDIDALIEGIWPDEDDAPNYKIVADSTLTSGSCALSWKDGGMVRDHEKIANDITAAIESLLVDDTPTKDAQTVKDTATHAIKNQDTNPPQAKAAHVKGDDIGEPS